VPAAGAEFLQAAVCTVGLAAAAARVAAHVPFDAADA